MDRGKSRCVELGELGRKQAYRPQLATKEKEAKKVVPAERESTQGFIFQHGQMQSKRVPLGETEASEVTNRRSDATASVSSART